MPFKVLNKANPQLVATMLDDWADHLVIRCGVCAKTGRARPGHVMSFPWPSWRGPDGSRGRLHGSLFFLITKVYRARR